MGIDRRKWYQWHSWAGLKLSLLLSFVLVTGTLATISQEIDWLTNPAMRVAPSAAPQRYQWAELYRSARDAFPQAQLLSIDAPLDDWFAVQVIALNDAGERFRIFLDPADNAVTGTGRWYNWQRFFRQTHRHLMLPLPIGITIVGLLSLPLLISLVTGIVAYRRWWKGFLSPPKRQAAPGPAGKTRKVSRRYWGQFHRFLGVWSLWFIALIALTGVWYLLERWGLDARYPDPVRVPAEETLVQPAVETLEQIAAEVRRQHPGFEVRSILLPNKPGDTFKVRGQWQALLVRDRANQLDFHPASGDLIALRRGEELGLHLRISEAADPLHFGTFGGRATRWTWFVFGLLLSALSISGVYLYGLRTLRNTAETSGSWRTAWRGMGQWKWPTGAAVALCLGLAAILFG